MALRTSISFPPATTTTFPATTTGPLTVPASGSSQFTLPVVALIERRAPGMVFQFQMVVRAEPT